MRTRICGDMAIGSITRPDGYRCALCEYHLAEDWRAVTDRDGYTYERFPLRAPHSDVRLPEGRSRHGVAHDMNRRGFMGSILALGYAPAIVRADSLMRIVPRKALVMLARPRVPDLGPYSIKIAKRHKLFLGDIVSVGSYASRYMVMAHSREHASGFLETELVRHDPNVFSLPPGEIMVIRG